MVSTVDPSAERSHCEVPLRRYCEVPLRRCTSEELVGCCAAKTDACEPGLEMGQLPPSGKEIAASSHAEVMPDRCDQCPIHQDMLGLYLACSYKNGDDGKAQVQHQCISLSRPRPRVQSRGSVVRSLLTMSADAIERSSRCVIVAMKNGDGACGRWSTQTVSVSLRCVATPWARYACERLEILIVHLARDLS